MESIFYFAQLFSGLNTVSILAIIFGFLGSTIFLMEGVVDYTNTENERSIFRKWAKKSFIILLIGIFGTVFIPSKETYLFMIGGKVVDNIVKDNPQVKEIPGNTLDLLNEYIKTKTEDLRKAKEEK